MLKKYEALNRHIKKNIYKSRSYDIKVVASTIYIIFLYVAVQGFRKKETKKKKKNG